MVASSIDAWHLTPPSSPPTTPNIPALAPTIGNTTTERPPSEDAPAGPGAGYDGPPIPESANWETHPLAADEDSTPVGKSRGGGEEVTKGGHVVGATVGDAEQDPDGGGTARHGQPSPGAAAAAATVTGSGGAEAVGVQTSPHYGGLCKMLLLKAARQLIEQRSTRNATSTAAAAGGASHSGQAETAQANSKASIDQHTDQTSEASASRRGGKAAVGELMPPGTIRFMSERLQLLGFLAQDEEWWEEEGSYFYAATVALLIPILGDYALIDDESRKLLGERCGALMNAVELLGKMSAWTTSPTNPRMDQAKVKAITKEQRGIKTAHCVARDLVRLIGNACYRNKANQAMVLKMGGVQLLLSRFVVDDNNPYIREWATTAISTLTEDNAEVQALIASIESSPSGVVTNEELEKDGMEVVLDPVSGKLQAKRK